MIMRFCSEMLSLVATTVIEVAMLANANLEDADRSVACIGCGRVGWRTRQSYRVSVRIRTVAEVGIRALQ